jgi:hypothetical protein
VAACFGHPMKKFLANLIRMGIFDKKLVVHAEKPKSRRKLKLTK